MNEQDREVICIHPVLETRGMIKEDGNSIYHISLKDCLACSGCAITEDEITLLSKQDPSIVFQELEKNPKFNVIISDMCISNLAAAKQCSISEAYGSIYDFFINKGAENIFCDSMIQLIWRKLLLNDYLNNKNIKKPYIISRCAGSTVFFERKSQYAHLLSQIKPFPQIYSDYLKKILNKNQFLLYLAPCYDRKLESLRFPEGFNAVLTISEIYKFLEFKTEKFINFTPINDVLSLIKELNPNQEIEIKNKRGIIEYKCNNLIGALISGASAHNILIKMLDQNNCPYDIIESNYCPLGCEAGGGLIRGESALKRKSMVENTIKAHNSVENLIFNEEINNIFLEINKIDLKMEYKSVEKNLNEKDNILDW